MLVPSEVEGSKCKILVSLARLRLASRRFFFYFFMNFASFAGIPPRNVWGGMIAKQSLLTFN